MNLVPLDRCFRRRLASDAIHKITPPRQANQSGDVLGMQSQANLAERGRALDRRRRLRIRIERRQEFIHTHRNWA
jgi:hypothetical protein